MLDLQIFDLQYGVHHLVNVALHATDSALLCTSLEAMMGALGHSVFIAALFAVHPLQRDSRNPAVWSYLDVFLGTMSRHAESASVQHLRLGDEGILHMPVLEDQGREALQVHERIEDLDLSPIANVRQGARDAR